MVKISVYDSDLSPNFNFVTARLPINETHTNI